MIYISGPTGTDDYLERFADAKFELMDKGIACINPACYNAQLPSDEVTYGGYIHTSLALLDLCDKIYMLDDWENSKSARLEHAYAEAMGKEIIYQTPPTEKEEKKYLWKLAGTFDPRFTFLNMRREDRKLVIGSKPSSEFCETRFTESEFKEMAGRYNFAENMFVKEEIE